LWNKFKLNGGVKKVKNKSLYVQSEWKSAFQLKHEGKLKIIPIFQDVKLIPNLLKPFLGIKFNEKFFDNFIQNLYNEILREN